jgi:hypothetical protein
MEVLTRVETYWETTRGNRLVPQRVDIDPRGLSGSLSHVFLVERIAAGLARFRVAGSHLSEVMGLEVRGMPLSAAFAPNSRENLADAVQALFDDPSIVHLDVEGEPGFGKPPLTGAMKLFPLRSDLGEISRALGVISMDGKVGRAPRRLEIRSQRRTGLVGFAGEDRTGLSAFRDRPQVKVSNHEDLQPATRLEKPKGASARRRETPSYLRLVSSDS